MHEVLVIKNRAKKSVNTYFLSLQIDNCLSWKNHTDQMIPKLSIKVQQVIKLDQCFRLVTMTHSNQFILPIFTL
jgi:hypothetical protein